MKGVHMRGKRIYLIVCAGAFALAPSVLGDEGRAQKKDDILKLIKELASPQYTIRENATSALISAGDLAVPDLQDERDKTRDTEVRRRIQIILARFGASAVSEPMVLRGHTYYVWAIAF